MRESSGIVHLQITVSNKSLKEMETHALAPLRRNYSTGDFSNHYGVHRGGGAHVDASPHSVTTEVEAASSMNRHGHRLLKSEVPDDLIDSIEALVDAQANNALPIFAKPTIHSLIHSASVPHHVSPHHVSPHHVSPHHVSPHLVSPHHAPGISPHSIVKSESTPSFVPHVGTNTIASQSHQHACSSSSCNLPNTSVASRSNHHTLRLGGSMVLRTPVHLPVVMEATDSVNIPGQGGSSPKPK